MHFIRFLAYMATALISALAWTQFCSATKTAPSLPLSELQRIISSSDSNHIPSLSTYTPTSLPPMESHAPTLDSMLKSCVFTEKPKSQPLEMTKTQFEELIGLALDVEFDLNVISDTTDPEFGNEDSGSDSELLGKIPVHLKIKELKIGGSLVPKMIAENWNLKVDPLNFGNIHNVV